MTVDELREFINNSSLSGDTLIVIFDSFTGTVIEKFHIEEDTGRPSEGLDININTDPDQGGF